MNSSGNSTAQKFKFNGVEHEEVLGLDLYEMPLRQYDPAIARWTSMDPITHFSNSTYNGFDNNPVFWADPSGADGEHYNWNTNRYENDQGEEVSFEAALASQGLNADGSDKNKNNSNSTDKKPTLNVNGERVDFNKQNNGPLTHYFLDEFSEEEVIGGLLDVIGFYEGTSEILNYATLVSGSYSLETLKDFPLTKEDWKKIGKHIRNRKFKKAKGKLGKGLKKIQVSPWALLGTALNLKSNVMNQNANNWKEILTNYKYIHHSNNYKDSKGLYIVTRVNKSITSRTGFFNKKVFVYDKATQKLIGSFRTYD